MISSLGIRDTTETLFRTVVKNLAFNKDRYPEDKPLPIGKLGNERILPPLLGEMGGEIRHHLARVEPWLNNGWKIMTKFPAFYPEGTAVHIPEFFAAADRIRTTYFVIGAYGAIYIPPRKSGDFTITDLNFTDKEAEITVKTDDLQHLAAQALAEAELRKLFLEWFYHPSRGISEYDRFVFSFASSALGLSEYHGRTALKPSFLPPGFVSPQEPKPPHVGVQIRHMTRNMPQPRNSDPEWMLKTAREIADHLGIDLLVYGNPNGCIIPEHGYDVTWNPDRPQNHMAREFGYLKSCRLMLAPDSGWADLMAWLGIPTLLERILWPGEYTPLKYSFKPRLRLFDRNRPSGAQADELLVSTECTLSDDDWPQALDERNFPWEP